jgi:phosphoribosyl 1,2-cyclic phosphodiesterase
MTLRFTVLGSGSGGNASLVQVDGFGVLLDIGLGPRQTARRLEAVGLGWEQVHAALLTHTHGDHWHERTLAQLCRLGIPLYCHEAHAEELADSSAEFNDLDQQGLVRFYIGSRAVLLGPGLRCRPLPLPHDGSATFGFRFEALEPSATDVAALGYATDLGTWGAGLAHCLADVDALALEFNHDVELQYARGRSPWLIRRILGDAGHLSNEQAAELLAHVLALSQPGRLRHVVQLHLSQDCNEVELAVQAARPVLDEHDPAVQLHTASQHRPGPTLTLQATPGARGTLRSLRQLTSARSAAQPWLPGWET